MNKNYVTLDMILNKDTLELTALKQGEFETEKLGLLPFTALDSDEFAQAKKECITMEPDGTGGMRPSMDDDKLMVRVVRLAVDKDNRSDFRFASKELLKKFNVINADDIVKKLLSPGEITRLAVEVQNVSGFGARAAREVQETVKNS